MKNELKQNYVQHTTALLNHNPRPDQLYHLNVDLISLINKPTFNKAVHLK